MDNAAKGGALIVGGIFATIFTLILSFILVISIGGVKKDDDQCGPEPGASSNNGPVQPLSADASENMNKFRDELEEASRTSGLPVSLLGATIQQESGWDVNVVSKTGAVGISQFMPATWQTYGEGDPRDPVQAIRAMGKYFRDLTDIIDAHPELKGDRTDMILRSYNAGPGAVLARNGGANSGENSDYAPLIRQFWPQYQGIVKDLGINDNPGDGKQEKKEEGGKENEKKDEKKEEKKEDNPKKTCKRGYGHGGGEDLSGDDYPWKDLPHCDGEEKNCPEHGDPTDAMPAECTAFAAWRVNKQIGNDAEHITFKSPGNASVWWGTWSNNGWDYDNKPEPGSVVYYEPNRAGMSEMGHVAIVKEVYEDGTFLEEGYNGEAAPNDHKYYTRKRKNDEPSQFLHIPDKAAIEAAEERKNQGADY